MNKVLVIAPFWQTPGHVGNYRIDRFIRWLKNNSYLIYVLRAGKKNEVQKTDYGVEITKKDYIFIITVTLSNLSNKPFLKIFWYLWRALILIFSPVDEFFVWTNKILSGFDFRKYIGDVDLVISTSPPNSSHIAAYKISKKYSIPLITDFRDGWLDEPLEQKLAKIRFLRRKEVDWEKTVITHSSKIFVTSETWKEMLVSRFSNISEKIKILTNAYPDFDFLNDTASKDKVSLLYTGRFAGSSKKRSLDLLLNPLYHILKRNEEEFEITLLSDLRREEFALFNKWKKEFASNNIALNLYAHLPRIKMFEFINQSSGLLLLSAGYGPLPSKLFEYVKSGKPIFAVTPKKSAVSQLAEKLPQLFLFDSKSDGEDYTSIIKFLDACKYGNYEYNIPDEFTENYISKFFLREVETVLK